MNETFDELKTKMLKYILYKKRTKKELENKFNKYDGNLVEDVIKYLEEAEYINDERYIKKATEEYMTLKYMSIKEIKYKLQEKGIELKLIEEYINNNLEVMEEYEKYSIEKLTEKKQKNLNEEEIKKYLFQKGFKI